MVDIEREGRAEGRDARQFKKDLDEESYLQTSMLADAGDEGLQLTRFTEADECETEELAQEVQDFIFKIKLLYEEGQCRNLPGYTQFAVHHLKEPRILYLENGNTKGFGGPLHPTEAVWNRCLQRMQAWTKLSVAVALTEFPDFEIFAAFAAFSLEKICARSSQKAGDLMQMHIKRLAQAFNQPAEELHKQLFDHGFIARRIWTTTQCRPREAFRLAIKKTQEVSKAMRAKHPATALIPVYKRLPVYKPTTTKVEQNFAQAKAALGEQGLHGSANVEVRTKKQQQKKNKRGAQYETAH